MRHGLGKKTAVLVLALVCGVLAGGARAAEDEGLYAPAPPAGAAFVRFLDVTSGPKALTLQLADQKFNAPKGGASPYRVVMQGEQTATLGPSSLPVTLFAGYFYSVIARGVSSAPTLSVLPDPASGDPAKAQLVLYNFTDREALRLATADGKTTILPAVAQGANGSRAVNPLQVTLGVGEAGGSMLAGVAPVQLERGLTYSVIASGSGKEIQATLAKGETAR